MHNEKLEIASEQVKRLYGLQRNILFQIVNHCISNGNLVTGPITLESLKALANTDIDTIKTAVQRLVNKKIITRLLGKRGVGGFSEFAITEEIKSIVIQNKNSKTSADELSNDIVPNIAVSVKVSFEKSTA